MTSEAVFEAIRRGYKDLAYESPSEIQEYFSNLDSVSEVGHINNIKGILFESEVVNALNETGLHATVFEDTNHPITDIQIFDDGDLIGEYQLKATDSIAYINDTLEVHPDVPIIATTEVANAMQNDMVIDSGIYNEDLTNEVSGIFSEDDTLSFVNDASSDIGTDFVSDGLVDSVADSFSPFPISPFGIILGLATGLPFFS